MITKNEFRKFSTEIEFVVKNNTPSTLKLVASLSPVEQLKERRSKFDFMVAQLFDKYGLDEPNLYDRFDELWEDNLTESLTGILKF